MQMMKKYQIDIFFKVYVFSLLKYFFRYCKQKMKAIFLEKVSRITKQNTSDAHRKEKFRYSYEMINRRGGTIRALFRILAS